MQSRTESLISAGIALISGFLANKIFTNVELIKISKRDVMETNSYTQESASDTISKQSQETLSEIGSEMYNLYWKYRNKMIKDNKELKSDESELIHAASNPPTTNPRKPCGSNSVTIVAKTISPLRTVLPSSILVGISIKPF